MTSLEDSDTPWLQHFTVGADCKAVLICFPHAGGSASFYFPLVAALAPDIQVLAVQYPGRQNRHKERFIENIPELAEAVFDVLKDRTGIPYALFGHSMGAIVCYEVARRLQASAAQRPVRLFLSGRGGPLHGRTANVHLLGDADLISVIQELGGTDASLLRDEELRRLVLPIIRNDYKAIESYRYAPGPKLTCPITALIGDGDPQVTIEQAAAWHEYTESDFGLRVFPGGHFYLNACLDDVTSFISETLGYSAAPA